MPANVDVGSVVAAIGALGLASFALVDATKALRQGGVSNSGFLFIARAIQQLLPTEVLGGSAADPNAPRPLLAILHANWIAGLPLADQKAIARSLIKVRLSPDTTARFAAAAAVKPEILKQIAEKMTDGRDLNASEANVLGRFDLALAAILDEGYQRADQRYRNRTRVYASIVSVVLAVLGGWAVSGAEAAGAMAASDYFGSKQMWTAFFCGLLATPLAPISKDLASALQAGVKLAHTLKR